MDDSSEFIMSNVLCFVNSAKSDFSKETLKDVAFSFFSHEDIKSAKQELCNLLKKDLVWRRDPEKKKKDLVDVLDLHEELTLKRNRFKFVCNSYKAMPPVGMELLAPLIINLSDEVGRINEMLPKIVDMRAEVLNTADTVRQMKVEIVNIKEKFESAVNGIQAAAEEITDEDVGILNELHSFRKSLSIPSGLPPSTEEVEVTPRGDQLLSLDVAEDIVGEVEQVTLDETSELVSDPRTGAVSKNGNHKEKSPLRYSDALKKKGKDGFSPQNGKQVPLRNESRKIKSDQVRSKNEVNRFRGVRKGGGYTSFKAVKRTADVFLGRIDKDTSVEVIQNYVKDTFSVVCLNIQKLEIKTDLYNAFKITVLLTDRDLLFNSDLWPEEVVVSKFYNRNKTSNNNNNKV